MLLTSTVGESSLDSLTWRPSLMTPIQTETTQTLIHAAEGDQGAIDRLLPLVYDELRSLAGNLMRHERDGHTLQPTALANEAFIRLIDQHSIDWKNRAHFFALAAQTMRRVLVDHARARGAIKRGGDRRRIALAEDAAIGLDQLDDLLALDEALHKLARLSERQARVVELRFFGGLSIEETAEMIGVSPRTVKGDWRVSRAWLERELADEC